MKKWGILFVGVVVVVGVLSAKTRFPQNGPLYDDATVPRVDIIISPDSLQWLYNNVNSDKDLYAMFVFQNGNRMDTIDSIGFRLRGNTSRYSQKKSFKVSFNSFRKGGKYFGVEKLNLNGEHNDPSLMRAKVMWDIFRQMEIPAPRANHVQLYINGNFYGVYLNVEHVDENFVKSRFENKNGNLFKCLYPADLDYLGSSSNAYKLKVDGRRVYDLKTNEDADDYSDLLRLVKVLNQTSNTNLVCDLGEIYNIYDYLKIMAVDMYCGNWDGYIFNKNNYYLYHNSATGRMEYIPYDVDNTFGIDWFGVNWVSRNVYKWKQNVDDPRPLYDRVMKNSELRNQFTLYSKKLLDEVLNVDSLIAEIEIRKNRIAPLVKDDPFYPLDYGYSYNDFLLSYTQKLRDHVKAGLYPYLKERKNSMRAQMENVQMNPVIKDIAHERKLGDVLSVTVKVDVAIAPANVLVQYVLNEGALAEKEMQRVGENSYQVLLTNISLTTKVLYQIKATDKLGAQSIMPCTMVFVAPKSDNVPQLFINELMANNTSSISDKQGNFSDWVEIYNGDTFDVFLGDMFLTDSINNPDKWKMPNVYLPAGGFMLIWLDEKGALGDDHANFKLNKNGEELGLFSSDLVLIDSIRFGSQLENVSYGRKTDGADSFITFNRSTPGLSNNLGDSIPVLDNKVLNVYPNPTKRNEVNFTQHISFVVYSISGVEVCRCQNVNVLDIRTFSMGTYIIVTSNSEVLKLLVE